MARRYRVGRRQRAINAVFARLAMRELGPRYLHVLTVAGRSSGLPRSVPVDVMELRGVRYLVAPYGEVNWVRNLRAAGSATLRRGPRAIRYWALELTPSQAIPVIREYVRAVPVTRHYWAVDNDSSDDEVRRDAESHPVFRLSFRPREG